MIHMNKRQRQQHDDDAERMLEAVDRDGYLRWLLDEAKARDGAFLPHDYPVLLERLRQLTANGNGEPQLVPNGAVHPEDFTRILEEAELAR